MKTLVYFSWNLETTFIWFSCFIVKSYLRNERNYYKKRSIIVVINFFKRFNRNALKRQLEKEESSSLNSQSTTSSDYPSTISRRSTSNYTQSTNSTKSQSTKYSRSQSINSTNSYVSAQRADEENQQWYHKNNHFTIYPYKNHLEGMGYHGNRETAQRPHGRDMGPVEAVEDQRKGLWKSIINSNLSAWTSLIKIKT